MNSLSAPSRRAVVCVDGIVSSGIRGMMPDVDWAMYAHWLSHRRPDLAVAHLKQPLDWRDILSGEADDYGTIVRTMLHELLAQRPSEWQEVVVLGYSLGGLTALNVAHEFMRRVQGAAQLEYLAFVTIGAPFGGTHAIRDVMLKRSKISHLERIYTRTDTLQYLRELVQGSAPVRLRVLLHHIVGDEMVSRDSAWLPAEWLEFAAPANDTQWGCFDIDLGRFRLMPHISFPHHPLGLAYVDGLIDGLLPPDGEDRRFEPFRVLPAERTQEGQAREGAEGALPAAASQPSD